MPDYGIEVLPELSDFSKFKLTFLGRDIIHLSSFEFDEKADISVVIGKGGMPVGWSKKKTEWDAKATIHQDEFKELIKLAAAYGGNVTQLPAMPLVAECPSSNGTWRLTIPAVKIKSAKQQFKQGDDKAEVPLDFVILGFPLVEVV